MVCLPDRFSAAASPPSAPSTVAKTCLRRDGRIAVSNPAVSNAETCHNELLSSRTDGGRGFEGRASGTSIEACGDASTSDRDTLLRLVRRCF